MVAVVATAVDLTSARIPIFSHPASVRTSAVTDSVTPTSSTWSLTLLTIRAQVSYPASIVVSLSWGVNVSAAAVAPVVVTAANLQ